MNIKPIKTKHDYLAALKRVEELWNADPNTPEGDELDILATLIQEYEDSEELNEVAVKLFMGIAREWSLTEEQCCKLAEINISDLHCWQNSILEPCAIKLSKGQLERLSLIAGIYKSIQLLFDDPNQWKEWVHKPNQHFEGRSALEEMLAGRVIEVRRYLDAWRQ